MHAFFQSFFGGCSAIYLLAFLLGLPARGALTVSAAAAAEGDGVGVPREAVFVLTLSAPVATDSIFEYTTSSDTAREVEDYAPARGRVTIPAGQVTAGVRVVLTGDAWQEGTESFSLIVWPAGTFPRPVMTSLVRSGGNASDQSGSAIGLSEGNWFAGNWLGKRWGRTGAGCGICGWVRRYQRRRSSGWRCQETGSATPMIISRRTRYR